MKRRVRAGSIPGTNYLLNVNSFGYTIMEVMIVLAVTGGLLLSAILMLGGRQAKTEAVESVRSLDSALGAMSREVTSGYFNSNYVCTANSTGAVSITLAAGTAGSNKGCIFLGKIINVESKLGTITSVVGRQYVENTTADVTSLNQAKPVLTSDVSTYNFLYDMTVEKIVDTSDTTVPYKALAFMIELGDASGSTSPLSGSRSVQLYGIGGSVGGNGALTGITGLTQLKNGATICMKTGNGKNAELTIGSGGNQYSTNELIDSGVDDVCKS